jgi:NAD(P)-dependent dehydrogenase (short-subunit alcohol dehydrogenase family)
MVADGGDNEASGAAGRVAVVTGAARGIGLEIARVLGADGTSVVAVDRDEEALRDAVAGLEAAGITAAAVCCDLAHAGAPGIVVEQAVHAFGRVDLLVNNAAIADPERFAAVDAASLRRTLTINLEAPYLLAQAVVRQMVGDGRGGCIINVASINGIVGVGRMSAYGVAKAGLIALTRSIAVEHAADGIRCNAVAPGPTTTRLLDGIEDAERERRLARIPLRRFGTTGDVASAVAYLASPASGYVTGHVLPVEGGYLALGTA